MTARVWTVARSFMSFAPSPWRSRPLFPLLRILESAFPLLPLSGPASARCR
jgi:hypothetical protein